MLLTHNFYTEACTPRHWLISVYEPVVTTFKSYAGRTLQELKLGRLGKRLCLSH